MLDLFIQRALAAEIKIPKGKGAEENLKSAMEYVGSFIDIALNIAGIIAIAMILYSSFLYLSSFGEESKAETAKKTLIWAAVGALVIVAAKFIINAVGQMLG